MDLFALLLKDMGFVDRYGADQDGYPWILGYRGPRLSELLEHSPVHVAAFIEDQMMIKSTAELALIRESIRWVTWHILCCSVIRRWVPPRRRSAGGQV